MASKSLVDIALKLAKQLGANTNKFLGTRTNISFLGKGPKDDLFFQQDINTEALSAFPLSKLLPQIESSMGYLTGGKLNDIQANKLIDNMTKMKEFHFPTQVSNVTDMATGTRNLTQEGLGALRDKTGDTPLTMPFLRGPEGVRPPGRGVVTDSKGNPIQNTEWANRLAKAEGVAAEETILPTRGFSMEIAEGPQKGKNINIDEFFKMTGAFEATKPSNKITSLKTITTNRAGNEFLSAYVGDLYKNSGVASSVDVPKKRAAAREFLNSMLKKETDLLPPGKGGTLESVVSAEDYKYITEGGGGALGDPLVLVKKYYGDEIAKRIPLDTRTEVIDAFVDNVRFAKDRSGRLTNDPGFNPDDIPEFAEGGRAGYSKGRLVKSALAILNKNKKNSEYMFKASDNVSPGYARGDLKYNAELLADQLAEDAGVIYDDLGDLERIKFYGTAYDYLAAEMGKNLLRKRNLAKITKALGTGEDLSSVSPAYGERYANQLLMDWKPGKGRKPSASGGLAKILEV